MLFFLWCVKIKAVIFMAENKNIYSESISVKSYDSDMFKEMSIPAIMRYFQEIGGHQLATVGLPYEKMFADGAVFLLNCVDIHINRPIPLWQPLTIETWCYGVNGAIFTRNNRLKTADGEVMAEGSAGWFLVDPESHRIIRPKEYPPALGIPMAEIPLLSDGRVRIKRPEQGQKLCDRKVLFSDADYNRHLNNTKYAEIITDLCTDELEKKRIRDFRIVYAGEARVGDTVEIFRENDVFFGTRDGERCFEAEVGFEQR